MPNTNWYVYVVQCADGSLYTGVATDLQRRLRQHNGELTGGARYTMGRRPVQLLWSEALADRGAAQRRESAALDQRSHGGGRQVALGEGQVSKRGTVGIDDEGLERVVIDTALSEPQGSEPRPED